MKCLIILRGLIEREKRDWVRSEGLDCFYISLNHLRTLFSRPERVGSRIVLTKSRDDNAYKSFLEVLISRMSSGNLVVVDMCGEPTGMVEDLAVIFGYTVFNKCFQIPFDFEKKYRSYLGCKFMFPTRDHVKKMIERERAQTYGNQIGSAKEICTKHTPTVVDPNSKVLVFGDVHSNYSKVKEVLDQNKPDLTVFLGDYIDGTEEGGSRKMIDYIISAPENTIFLSGNHELRLQKWLGVCWMRLKGRKLTASILEETLPSDFMNTTMKEFSDLTGNDYETLLRNLARILKPYYVFQKGDKKFVCSHVGMESLDKINNFFIGDLTYTNDNPDKLDDRFSRLYAGKEVYSVHGHCKYPSGSEFTKYPRTINLDSENDSTLNHIIL